MSKPDASLPETWVARIFDKLALTYGAEWLRRWEGLDLSKVAADWGHELAGFVHNPPAIAHALRHLPVGKPPTVLQFRELCLSAPKPAPTALPAPPADPVRVAKALEGLNSARQGANDPLAWARMLRDRESAQKAAKERGHPAPQSVLMTLAQRSAWREALGAPPEPRRGTAADDAPGAVAWEEAA